MLRIGEDFAQVYWLSEFFIKGNLGGAGENIASLLNFSSEFH